MWVLRQGEVGGLGHVWPARFPQEAGRGSLGQVRRFGFAVLVPERFFLTACCVEEVNARTPSTAHPPHWCAIHIAANGKDRSSHK
eukprot:8383804-Alexandrium_andersonii.AAC.1